MFFSSRNGCSAKTYLAFIFAQQSLIGEQELSRFRATNTDLEF